MSKAIVTLGGFPLAGNSGITWRLTTGTQPYQTVVSLDVEQWQDFEGEGNLGKPLELRIRDSMGSEVRFQEVYALHVVPSSSPNRVSFIIADKRWKWPYKLIVRDYNIPKKTGDRTAFGEVPLQVIVDQYQYKRSSLDPEGNRWTARRAVEDVLESMGDEAGYEVASFPVNEGNQVGEVSIQNLQIRDSADAALGRVLAQVPGADVFVDHTGKTVIFDASDLRAAEEHRESLPPATWEGDKSEQVDRIAVRPGSVELFYQREVEILLEHHDDYQTITQPNRDQPYLENVIPTVDTETEITQYDPESDRYHTYTVPAGTYVPVVQWLAAMDERRPADAFEWTFERVRKLWLMGDLEGALGTKVDDEERANIYARVAAFRQHFRQTFRLNRRFVERIRDIAAVRVALLDPITGARAPAGVWGQACIIPTEKGKRRIARRGTAASLFENIDATMFPGDIVEAPVSPASVSIIDKDQGILRVDWLEGPYGHVASIIPCHMVNESGELASPIGDLGQQDRAPMGAGIQVGSTQAFGLFLAWRQHMYVLLTVVPCAPNDERQYHKVTVRPEDIRDQYAGDLRIQNGQGPVMQVFVPPGEASARFGWIVDQKATATLVDLFGLDDDDPSRAGSIESGPLDGFLLVNGEDVARNELTHHSRAMAAEVLVPYADSVMGRVATVMRGDRPPTIKGNMSGASVNIAGAPGGSVMVLHEFPGMARPMSRLALLPSSVRRLILGVVDPGIGD